MPVLNHLVFTSSRFLVFNLPFPFASSLQLSISSFTPQSYHIS
jgi:hypothetical protein